MVSDDFVNLYSEVRPVIPVVNKDKIDICNEDDIKYISLKAKNVIDILDYVEYYTEVFIWTSAFGFVLALLLIVMRSKNIVNNTT